MPLYFLWTAQSNPCTMLWKYIQVHPENLRAGFRRKKERITKIRALCHPSCVHWLSSFKGWLMLLQMVNTSPFYVVLPSLSWYQMQMTRRTINNFSLCGFKKNSKKSFCILIKYQCSELLQEKYHIQSYLQPGPYLKGILTCLSCSSSVFSSSDARTIPLSVWFSCKSGKNALNGKGLKKKKRKK